MAETQETKETQETAEEAKNRTVVVPTPLWRKAKAAASLADLGISELVCQLLEQHTSHI